MEDKNTNSSYYLRIAVGAYVAYLGVKLVMGYVNEETGANPVILGIFSVLFVVIGGFFVVSSLIGLYKNRSDENSGKNEGEYGDAEKVSAERGHENELK